MEFTKSRDAVVDQTTGWRRHEDRLPVPTTVSANDMNMMIWSLMQVVRAAGLAEQDFDPTNPDTYNVFKRAIDKLYEPRRSSLLKYGGLDDDATDNLNALSLLMADNPPPCLIELPRKVGKKYYFSGFDNTGALNGYTFDPEPGVTIRCAAGQFGMHPGLSTTRPMAILCDSPKYRFTLIPQTLAPIEAKGRWLDAGSLDQSKQLPIDCASELKHYSLDAWPAGKLVPAAPAATSTSTVDWAINAGAFFSSLTPVVAGQEISAVYTNQTQAGHLCFVVKTVHGCVHGYQAKGVGQAITVVRTVNGATVSEGGTYQGYSNHASYAGQNSVWTVRVHSSRAFSLLFNGFEVYRCLDAGDDILEVGFGGGFVVGGGFTIANWVRTVGKPVGGKRPIKMLVVGDSISDPRVEGQWPNYAVEALEGAAGIRIMGVRNIAVSGNTSGQQLVALNNTDVSDISAACILVGTNDTQSAMAPAETVANVQAMLAKLPGVPVIVGIPPLWYLQAQTPGGNLGVASLNYEKGGEMRAALARAIADLKNPLIKTVHFDDMGAILGDWLEGYPTPKIDPVLRDNLHPGTFGGRLIGYHFAKALAGLLQPRASRAVPLTALPSTWFANGFGSLAGNETSVSVSEAGVAQIGGWVTIPGAAPAVDAVIATLPINWAPSVKMMSDCVVYNGAFTKLASSTLQLLPNGELRNAAALPAGAAYVLPVFVYPTRDR